MPRYQLLVTDLLPLHFIGSRILNLLPVGEYNHPKFPIEDDLVSYITPMGAPITDSTAKEMCRVLGKNERGCVPLRLRRRGGF
jgi:hypothetical protein